MTRPKLLLGLVAALLLVSGQAYAWAARATADVNMRTGPSTRYRVIVVVPRGAYVDVRHCNGWCLVDYRGYRGYVSGRYLSTRRYRERRIYRTPPPAWPPTIYVPRRYDPWPRHRDWRRYDRWRGSSNDSGPFPSNPTDRQRFQDRSGTNWVYDQRRGNWRNY